jgi:hypothetical protein
MQMPDYVNPGDETERHSLSLLQQAMLFHHLSAPEAGTDIEQLVCTLRPELRGAFEARRFLEVSLFSHDLRVPRRSGVPKRSVEI